MEGKTKLAVDIKYSTKEKLKEVAHMKRTSLTAIVEELIESAYQATGREKN